MEGELCCRCHHISSTHFQDETQLSEKNTESHFCLREIPTQTRPMGLACLPQVNLQKSPLYVFQSACCMECLDRFLRAEPILGPGSSDPGPDDLGEERLDQTTHPKHPNDRVGRMVKVHCVLPVIGHGTCRPRSARDLAYIVISLSLVVIHGSPKGAHFVNDLPPDGGSSLR